MASSHERPPHAGASSDLEAAHPRHSHQHVHHGAARGEEELSSTAVLWDNELHEWRSQEEEEEDARSNRSTRHASASRTRQPQRHASPPVHGDERIRDEEDERMSEATVAESARVTSEKKAPFERASAAQPGVTDSATSASLPKEIAESDVIWLEWEKGDPENPFNWSNRKKWQTCLLACLFTFLVAYCGTAFASGTPSMMRDLNCSHELAVLGLSIFPLGFGLGPLFTAPLSEAYGRYPLYVVSSVLYTVFFIPTAYGQNIATVIIARFIGGIAASTGSTLVGGTVADLFETHNRGLPMSIFSICAFMGTGLGPAVSGYIELKKGWRWIEWVQMMFGGVMAVLLILFTRETRGSVILSRRAHKLRKETGDPRYQCRSDAERASLAVLVRVSMTRPIYLLGTEAIVFFFSLWAGVSWGTLYLLVEALPLIFGNVYDFNAGEVGLTFYSVIIASFIGFGVSFYQERLYRKHVARRGPEARLYTALVGGLVFPAGAFILAFSQGRGHWMGPVIGVTLIFTGVYTIYLAVFSYLADCYTIYASSALSGQSLCRNLMGFSMPLFTTQMYNGLGYQWASFLAGCIALVLAATPWILFRFGPTIRARSRFAKELARMRGED
ncbi:hypothetical protein JCM10908_004039 [Rhodotorula pacifica]|uniref:MFS transporter n=1 Tax=Rhodotorula pacifica TaxID=1495444 RepID=UPI00317A0E04